MGIADTGEIGENPEMLLVWSIPDQWSLEDAVTVPMAYVKVLKYNPKLKNLLPK